MAEDPKDLSPAPIPDRIVGRPTLAIAAVLGLVGVVAGAFGAHGLREVVSARDLANWGTAARYQQIHAVLLAAIAMWGGPTKAMRAASGLLVVGIVVFSGTLYAMVLGGPRILGAVTPLGGLCLIAGWGALLVHALSRGSESATPRS